MKGKFEADTDYGGWAWEVLPPQPLYGTEGCVTIKLDNQDGQTATYNPSATELNEFLAAVAVVRSG